MALRKPELTKLSAEVVKDVAVSGVKIRARHDGWTELRQRRFLQTLAMTGCVRDACRVAGMSNQSGYRLRRISPEFAAAWDRAREHSTVSLRAAAWARAVEGVEEPVYQGGKLVGTRIKWSDSLLRTLLMASDPETFGPQAGKIGRVIPVKQREEIEKAAYERGREDLQKEQHIDQAERRRLLDARMSEMNRRMGGPG